jgi:NAD(P)-dependent dehydrogenase (short-subunit alcohol dehydrogenase family)
MSADIADRRVLVIGGSSGIGEGIAHVCAHHGAHVTIASRSPDNLTAAATRIGAPVEMATIDVRDDDSVAALFANAAPYDHVVVSGANVRVAPVRDLAPTDAQQSMNAKFWGAYRVAHWANITPAGTLTLISGAASVRAVRGRALQRAMNAAVEALTKGLALELSPVRVNAVSPGIIATPAWTHAGPDRRLLLDALVANTPVGQPGRPEHIARQVIACIENEFMTGSVIYVDGGYLA